jgi:hypothetical protein
MLELALLDLSSRSNDHDAQLLADREARTLAAKAVRLSLNDPEALFLFYRSFSREPDGPTRNAVDALHLAYLTVPQNPQFVQSYVQELLRAHDTDQAVLILRRIAYAPHGGEASKWAVARLREIEGTSQQGTSGP